MLENILDWTVHEDRVQEKTSHIMPTSMTAINHFIPQQQFPIVIGDIIPVWSSPLRTEETDREANRCVHFGWLDYLSRVLFEFPESNGDQTQQSGTPIHKRIITRDFQGQHPNPIETNRDGLKFTAPWRRGIQETGASRIPDPYKRVLHTKGIVSNLQVMVSALGRPPRVVGEHS